MFSLMSTEASLSQFHGHANGFCIPLCNVICVAFLLLIQLKSMSLLTEAGWLGGVRGRGWGEANEFSNKGDSLPRISREKNAGNLPYTEYLILDSPKQKRRKERNIQRPKACRGEQ